MDILDPETVRAFVEAIHAGAQAACAGLSDPGLLQISKLHRSNAKLIPAGRFQLGDVDRMTAAVLADAQAGYNCYVEPRTIRRGTPRRGTGDDTQAVFAIVIDRDSYSGKAGREFADPTLRVETSPGSGHDWFFLRRAISAEDAQHLGTDLRAVSGADSATGKPTQPYRIAGTPNFPNAKKQALGRTVCATNFANGGPVYGADELRELIGGVPVETPAPAGPSPFDAQRTGLISGRAEKILAKPVTAETDRSTDFHAAVCAAVEDGMTAQDFEALARAHPNGCAVKYLEPSDRLQVETERVWRRHAAFDTERLERGARLADGLMRAAPVAALPIVSAAEWDGKPIPERPWHVPGLIPANTVTLLGGDGGTGKSLLAAQLAAATVLSATWIGFEEVTWGPAVYLSAEDDIDELHRRFARILSAMGATFADAQDLHIMPFAGEDAVLAAPEGRANIVKATPLLGMVESAIKNIAPALIVLDTLADLFAGDENQRAQARQFLGLLRGLALRHTCAIVLLAHPSLSGMSSGRGTSGSTAWSNSVRSQLYLSRILRQVENRDIEEPDESLRELTVKKSNYSGKGAPIRLKWVDGVFERQVSAFGLDSSDHDTTAELVFMRLLRLTEGQGIRVGASPAPNYAPKIFAGRDDASGITKRAFKGAMERLLNQGKIRTETLGPPSKQRSYLTAYGSQKEDQE